MAYNGLKWGPELTRTKDYPPSSQAELDDCERKKKNFLKNGYMDTKVITINSNSNILAINSRSN